MIHRFVRVGLPLPRRPDRSGVVPPWLYDYAVTRRWIGYDREMRDVDSILDEVYVGEERVSRDEIYRRAVAVEASADVVGLLDALPEGEYTQDEAAEALSQIGGRDRLAEPGAGVPGSQLGEDELLRELGELHRTRHDTLRHGSDQALAHHDERLAELEDEYRRRFPQREVDPERLRDGARTRTDDVRRLEDSST
jgi:hypothetical protein